MKSFAWKAALAVGFAVAATIASVGPAAAAAAPGKAPAKTAPPVEATRIVPAQPSQAGPNRIGVLVFFDFNPASEDLLGRLPTWLAGTGRQIVLDREPLIAGNAATPLARAFMVARTLGVTDSVLPALFRLAAASPDVDSASYAGQQEDAEKLRSLIAPAFKAVGINGIEFAAAWNSPATAAGISRARAMSLRFQVTGAPVLIVNGEWKLIPAPGAKIADLLAALNGKIAAAAARIAANR